MMKTSSDNLSKEFEDARFRTSFLLGISNRSHSRK